MDSFEREFLACRSEAVAIIPGPLQFQEPYYSTAMYQMEMYPAREVIACFSSLAGVTLLQRGSEEGVGWYDWKWRWEQADRRIDIGFSIFDEPEYPIFWGGSELNTDCLYADILRLWRALQSRLPAVWVHGDDCRVYTPPSFVETFVWPALERAFHSNQESVRLRARQEKLVYKALLK